MPTRLHQDTDNLLEVWKNNWEGLEDDKASVDAILEGIEHTRTQMLSLLQSLE
jgi:conjugal transfer/entry exclusion protein